MSSPMGTIDALGVYRESRFSPGRVEDDRAILDATAERLRAAGASVAMVEGEVVPGRGVAPRLVFAMCQGAEALAWLDALECPVVNRPTAIRSCFRTNLVRRLDEGAVPQPGWRLAGDSFPEGLGAGPWLKRGDVHAMEAADVRRIFTEAGWREALADLSGRGVGTAIVQQHHEGQVYKFYGAEGGFFRAFGLPAGLEAEAAALAAKGAHALGLDVWGGDGVAGADGSLLLIDFNDWPSFSRCRNDAADAIARRLLEVLEGRKKRNDQTA